MTISRLGRIFLPPGTGIFYGKAVFLLWKDFQNRAIRKSEILPSEKAGIFPHFINRAKEKTFPQSSVPPREMEKTRKFPTTGKIISPHGKCSYFPCLRKIGSEHLCSFPQRIPQPVEKMWEAFSKNPKRGKGGLHRLISRRTSVISLSREGSDFSCFSMAVMLE